MTPRQEKLSSAAASDGLPLLPRGRNSCDDRPEGWSTPSSRSSAGLVTSTTHGDLNGDLEQMPTCMGPMVWGNRGELRGAASVSLCAICRTINPKHSPHPARCPHHGSLHHDLGPSRAEVVVNSHLPTDAMCSCARCAGDMNGGAGPDAAPHNDNSVSSPSQLIHAKWHSRSPCPSAITPGTARRRKPEAATFGRFPGHTGACPLSQVQLWSPMPSQVRC